MGWRDQPTELFLQNNFIKSIDMKKTKSFVRKIVFVLVLLGGYVLIGGSYNTETSASNGNVLTTTIGKLTEENLVLKESNTKLEQRLKEMEEKIALIETEDHTLYAELMGLNFDTTDLSKFRNDSAKIIIAMHDSIFGALDERSLYASELLALKLEKIQQTSEWFRENKHVVLYYPTISPIRTIDFICVSSQYGWREDPFTKKNTFHEGLDISARVGTDVVATASGTVVKITYSKYGYGNKVLIKHNYGFETLYAHLGVIKVKKGQWVNKGNVIGTVGNTGRSTGPHLHYEIKKNGQPRDPMGYFYTHITGELLAMN